VAFCIETEQTQLERNVATSQNNDDNEKLESTHADTTWSSCSRAKAVLPAKQRPRHTSSSMQNNL
jgi:hypothetical protein